MFSFKNLLTLFTLVAGVISLGMAAEEHPSSALAGEVFQLHGIRGEGHQCEDLKELSSALVLLVKQIEQQEGDGQHCSLQSCSGTSQGCRYWWCCQFCGWNCRRTLRGAEEESFLVAAGHTEDITAEAEDSVVEDNLNAEIHDLALIKQGDEGAGQHRSLQSCSGTSQGCPYWWCCQFCGWNCRRALEEETSSIVSWLEETSVEELPGCLAGTTLTLSMMLEIDEVAGN